MNRVPMGLAGLLLVMLSGPLAAAESLGPVPMSGTEHYVLHNDALDLDYRIDVALPLGYAAGDASYPVVYVTDGNFLFPIVVSNTRLLGLTGELPPVIMVGVGYQSADPMAAGVLRNRDLTPTLDKAWAAQARAAPPPFNSTVDPGGAPAFARFIEQQVKPLINANYRTVPEDETLVGYSLGGLFTMYVLFHHGDTYDRYLVGSPSLWWHDRVSFDYEQRYAADNKDLDARVYISIGSLEEQEGDDSQMVTNARLMYEQLAARAYPGLTLEHEVLGDETHTSGIGSAMVRGMLALFPRQR